MLLLLGQRVPDALFLFPRVRDVVIEPVGGIRKFVDFAKPPAIWHRDFHNDAVADFVVFAIAHPSAQIAFQRLTREAFAVYASVCAVVKLCRDVVECHEVVLSAALPLKTGCVVVPYSYYNTLITVLVQVKKHP